MKQWTTIGDAAETRSNQNSVRKKKIIMKEHSINSPRPHHVIWTKRQSPIPIQERQLEKKQTIFIRLSSKRWPHTHTRQTAVPHYRIMPREGTASHREITTVWSHYRFFYVSGQKYFEYYHSNQFFLIIYMDKSCNSTLLWFSL